MRASLLFLIIVLIFAWFGGFEVCEICVVFSCWCVCEYCSENFSLNTMKLFRRSMVLVKCVLYSMCACLTLSSDIQPMSAYFTSRLNTSSWPVCVLQLADRKMRKCNVHCTEWTEWMWVNVVLIQVQLEWMCIFLPSIEGITQDMFLYVKTKPCVNVQNVTKHVSTLCSLFTGVFLISIVREWICLFIQPVCCFFALVWICKLLMKSVLTICVGVNRP